MALLAAHNLHCGYGTDEIIHGIDFAVEPGEARGDSERRRRRRGRRGGRRNRRDREGEAPFASDRGRAGEPELNRATADFDYGPATEPLHEQPMAREPIAEPQRDTPQPTAVEPQDERPAPVAVPALPDTIAPAPEPPRRRSTVREPAPVGLTGEAAAPAIAHPAEPPQPVISGPTESEDSDRPRRSGWWSKRALGKG